MISLNRIKLIANLLIMAFLITACSGKKVRKDRGEGRDGSRAAAEEGLLGGRGRDATEASIRGSDFVETEGLATIHFIFDSANLKAQVLGTLKRNAEYLKEHPELEFLIAGHCDERGTVEYNLALGQNRAKAVRDYYVSLGVRGGAIATISYGEEKQVCAEAFESCWSLNRRAETRVRAR